MCLEVNLGSEGIGELDFHTVVLLTQVVLVYEVFPQERIIPAQESTLIFFLPYFTCVLFVCCVYTHYTMYVCFVMFKSGDITLPKELVGDSVRLTEVTVVMVLA